MTDAQQHSATVRTQRPDRGKERSGRGEQRRRKREEDDVEDEEEKGGDGVRGERGRAGRSIGDTVASESTTSGWSRKATPRRKLKRSGGAPTALHACAS